MGCLGKLGRIFWAITVRYPVGHHPQNTDTNYHCCKCLLGQASTGSYPGLIGGYGDGDKRTGNNARTPDIRLRGEEDTKSVESTVSRSKQSLFDTGFDRLVGRSSNQRYYNQHHYQQHQQSKDSRGRHQEQQVCFIGYKNYFYLCLILVFFFLGSITDTSSGKLFIYQSLI